MRGRSAPTACTCPTCVAPSYAYAKKGYDTLRAIVDRLGGDAARKAA